MFCFFVVYHFFTVILPLFYPQYTLFSFYAPTAPRIVCTLIEYIIIIVNGDYTNAATIENAFRIIISINNTLSTKENSNVGQDSYDNSRQIVNVKDDNNNNSAAKHRVLSISTSPTSTQSLMKHFTRRKSSKQGQKGSKSKSKQNTSKTQNTNKNNRNSNILGSIENGKNNDNSNNSNTSNNNGDNIKEYLHYQMMEVIYHEQLDNILNI